VHGLGYLHRDIKPANFCVGLGPRSQEIFLVDFGFVKSYLTVADDDGPSSEGKDSGGGDGGRRDASRRVHMAEKTGCRMRGTARYASLRNHMGVEQTRRDDMETLGYVALYMLRGSLPWQSCVIPPKKPKHLQKRQGNERFDEIMRMKRDTSHEDLCMEWPGGTQFVTYMKYCRSLAYAEEPDYAMLIDLFEGILEKTLGLDPHDCGFDWPFSRFRYGGIVPPARGKARWPKATFKACEGPRQEAYASKCLAQAEEAAAAWHRQERKAGRKT
jgi:serine/threonine protein kinase